MGMSFLHGQNGGGSDLNFATNAYSSESELLASAPKENTLGVVTNIPPSAWGFYNAAPGWEDAEGMVYFVVPLFTSVEAASFNATKKYRLWLAPTGCYQRISGAWKSMTAYIYKGGSWLQFSYNRLYLFNNGDQCTAVTGGWNGSTTTTDGNTYLYCQVNSDKDMTRPSTKSTVPTSSYSKLCVECIPVSQEGSGGSNFTCCVSNKASGDYITDYAKYAASLKDLTIGAEYTFEIDISGVTVDAYVRFTAYYSYMKYHRIWLE